MNFSVSVSESTATVTLTNADGISVTNLQTLVNVIAKELQATCLQQGSYYAKLGVAACIKSGIVKGTSVNTLSPKADVNRAEVATMIQQLLQKSGLI
jgi:hypothetical protein